MSELFSSRLRKARGEKSQGEVCQALDIKQGTYSTWELGRYQPSFEVLVKLACYFGVTTDWLLGMPINETSEKLASKKLECAKKAFFKLTEAVKELEGAL
ncbi:MAG: helix-turn-helix domain-containing protein [Porticoccaceae bacterium]|nr:helix-turn-helix domain-containing protein [Porticoccaceae bacterium]